MSLIGGIFELAAFCTAEVDCSAMIKMHTVILYESWVYVCIKAKEVFHLLFFPFEMHLCFILHLFPPSDSLGFSF